MRTIKIILANKPTQKDIPALGGKVSPNPGPSHVDIKKGIQYMYVRTQVTMKQDIESYVRTYKYNITTVNKQIEQAYSIFVRSYVQP